MLQRILEMNFLPLGISHLSRSYTVQLVFLSCFVFFSSLLLWSWINVCPKDYFRAHVGYLQYFPLVYAENERSSPRETLYLIEFRTKRRCIARWTPALLALGANHWKYWRGKQSCFNSIVIVYLTTAHCLSPLNTQSLVWVAQFVFK